jgi:hypothetical protein
VDVEVVGPPSETISSVSDRACALAADQIAGAGVIATGRSQSRHGFEEVATLHGGCSKTPEGKTLWNWNRKVCANP